MQFNTIKNLMNFTKLLNAFDEGKVFTSQGSDVPCLEIYLYRVVHLLVELCNHVLGSLLFLFLLACGTSQVVSAIATILHASSMDILIVLFFIATVFQISLVYIVVYGFAGNFYRDSKLSLLELSKHASNQLNKIVVRKEQK